MTERQPPQTNRRLVRFWLLFWPMLISGLLVVGVLIGLILPLGLFYAAGEEAVLEWLGGTVEAKSALFPAILAAAILAIRFSGGAQVPVGLANAIGAVLGSLAGLSYGGLISNALIGVAIGDACCLAMWGVGKLLMQFWPDALEKGASDG